MYEKTSQDIRVMREGGERLGRVFAAIASHITSGVSTMDIENQVVALFKKEDLEVALKGYNGFPHATCVSINNEVVHGIPSKKRKLYEGDIVSVDTVARYHDRYVDACRSYPIGKISPEVQKLLDVTKKAMQLGIAQVKVGGFIGDIGAAIQTYVEGMGFSVVRDLVGHGVGIKVHEPPQVPHFGHKGTGERLSENMVITIEPMVAVGDYSVHILKDNWTFVTDDGSLAAQFEETVVVTAAGPEVLTKEP